MTIITVDLILEISVISEDLTFRILNEYSEGESYFQGKKPIFSMVYLLLLRFTLLSFTDSAPFFQFESLLESSLKQVYRCGFSNSICSLCISVSHFANSHNISNF